MNRRLFLLLSATAPLVFADTQQEVTDLAGDLAAALANSDAEAFLTHVVKNMPDRATLRDNLFGLVTSADCNSGVELLKMTTDAGRTIVELDWSMHVVAKDNTAQVEQRHETVTLELEKQGKHWKVLNVKPIAFFRSMSVALR